MTFIKRWRPAAAKTLQTTEWCVKNWHFRMNMSQSSQHCSSSSLALSIFQLPCAPSSSPSLLSHPSCSFPMRLSVASPQLSLKASLMTSTWHRGPNAFTQLKLLKLFCQPSQRHQWYDPKDTQRDELRRPSPHPRAPASCRLYAQSTLQMAAWPWHELV